MMEAQLNRVMIEKAQKVIVGFAKIIDTNKIDQIITDSHINAQLVRQIESMGIELSIIPVPE